MQTTEFESLLEAMPDGMVVVDPAGAGCPESRRTVVRVFSAVARASRASRGYLQQLTSIWSRKGKR